MAKFKIVLHEVFQTIVEVEADNVDQAREKVEGMWYESEVGAYNNPRTVNYIEHETWEA